MSKTYPAIAVSWHRLPPYAAHLISAGIKAIDVPVHIVASKPPNLVSEVEKIIDQPIYWINSDDDCSWSSLGLEVPKIFFQSGWLSSAFKKLGIEVKQAGGKIVCFSDNSWKNTPRQWIGLLGFRVKYLKRFDAAWVPGKAGINLMEFYGMPRDKIYQGMYGSSPEVFKPGISLEKRPKKFIFVGQLIERKGISTLLNAFEEFRTSFPEWKLHIIGGGPLELPTDDPNIQSEGFSTPHRVAEAMRDSRFLILPSLEDHWGLVVHEGACSGCGIIVSDSVGAGLDLVTTENGYIFKTNSVESLTQALVAAASRNVPQLQLAYENSLSLANQFGTHTWPEIFKAIIHDLGGNQTVDVTATTDARKPVAFKCQVNEK
ncbi:glycosyltransferase [Leptothoe sp. PORK10 BA2]|uniref:glycosyltransferase n=1 Tax=Leptothoe sp. PORK10 BA2 TaxID=3110254 RepID=UPI002B21713D|nr:glycosyltransferase [Leptothoe sp. PORK10 BA2]MEA5466501.1 glycosyltransferase [Leptothoe sp. PORK10 BA2]